MEMNKLSIFAVVHFDRIFLCNLQTRTLFSRKLKVHPRTCGMCHWSILRKFWICMCLKTHFSSWMKSTLIRDQAKQRMSTEGRVKSDSYCTWKKMNDSKDANTRNNVKRKNSKKFDHNFCEYLRINWIGVAYSVGIIIIIDSCENRSSLTETENRFWDIHKSGHLHVNADTSIG